jgi:hypothetical protein
VAGEEEAQEESRNQREARDMTRGQRILTWLESSTRCQRCGAKIVKTEPHVHVHLTWGRWRVAHQRCMGIETDYHGVKESGYLCRGQGLCDGRAFK